MIGEVIKGLVHVDEQTASQISNYTDYIGFRNVLVHKYGKVDHYIVWEKIKDNLDMLEHEIDTLLNKLD